MDHVRSVLKVQYLLSEYFYQPIIYISPENIMFQGSLHTFCKLKQLKKFVRYLTIKDMGLNKQDQRSITEKHKTFKM